MFPRQSGLEGGPPLLVLSSSIVDWRPGQKHNTVIVAARGTHNQRTHAHRYGRCPGPSRRRSPGGQFPPPFTFYGTPSNSLHWACWDCLRRSIQSTLFKWAPIKKQDVGLIKWPLVITSGHLRHVWTPGVNWRTWSCPLVIGSTKTHVNARCEQSYTWVNPNPNLT